MKKIVLLLSIFITLSLVSFGQIDDDDAQMFGSSRPVPNYNEYDFGTISSNSVQHQFVIKNSSPASMTVVNIDAPQGVGVVLVDKIISPKSVGKFIVTINKNLIQIKGDFNQKIVITVEQDSALGKISKEIEYTIKGNL